MQELVPIWIVISIKGRQDIYMRKLGYKLRLMLPKIGPAFVKLAQFISTREDLIHPIICEELKLLQDQAPKIHFSKLEKILKQELRQLYGELAIEFEAIAAASVAQVHRGTIIVNNKRIKVAIKILKPNIRKKFQKNLDLLFLIAKFLNTFISSARRLRLMEVVNVISDTATAELNMQTEAAAADKLRYNFSSYHCIYIPKVFWQYTTKSILVTEWIDGVKINGSYNFNKKEIGKKLAFAFFQQIYVDGFFHADIHPGNILINTHGQIVLLDFGMFSYLPEKDRLLLAQIIYAFVKKDYEKVADLHFKAGYIKGDMQKTRNRFAMACRTIAEPIFDRPTSDIAISKLLRRLFEVTSEFNMHTQPQLLLLQKNMVALEGVLHNLDSNLNMWQLVEPWFVDWAEQNLNIAATFKRKILCLMDYLQALEDTMHDH